MEKTVERCDEPAMPYNLVTGKVYQGSNIFLLWSAANKFGLDLMGG